MARNFNYTAGRLSIEEIGHLYAKVSSFAGFEGFSSEDWQGAEVVWKGAVPAKLSDFTSQCNFVILRGILPRKESPWPMIHSILAHDELSASGSLMTTIRFKLRGSSQTKRNCESVFLIAKAKGVEFGYTSSISDSSECREQFLRSIGTASLPLEIQDTERGYQFQHTGGGLLFASGGNLGEINAREVKCGLDGVTAPECIKKMKNVVETFSEQIFEADWTAISDYAYSPDVVTRFLKLVLSMGFPAERTELSLSYKLAQWQEIEQLRALCGESTQFDTEICAFDLADKDRCVVTVRTTIKGHELILNLRDSAEAETKRKIGLKLQQIE